MMEGNMYTNLKPFEQDDEPEYTDFMRMFTINTFAKSKLASDYTEKYVELFKIAKIMEWYAKSSSFDHEGVKKYQQYRDLFILKRLEFFNFGDKAFEAIVAISHDDMALLKYDACNYADNLCRTYPVTCSNILSKGVLTIDEVISRIKNRILVAKDEEMKRAIVSSFSKHNISDSYIGCLKYLCKDLDVKKEALEQINFAEEFDNLGQKGRFDDYPNMDFETINRQIETMKECTTNTADTALINDDTVWKTTGAICQSYLPEFIGESFSTHESKGGLKQ